MTEALGPQTPSPHPTLLKGSSVLAWTAPAPSRFHVGALGSPRPSRPLPWPGPFFQHMQNITFQMESSIAEKEGEFQSPKYIFHSFMERLWAYLTIQQLLEKMWVAHTFEGPAGQPHIARAPSQASHREGGSCGHRVSPKHRGRGLWHPV